MRVMEHYRIHSLLKIFLSLNEYFIHIFYVRVQEYTCVPSPSVESHNNLWVSALSFHRVGPGTKLRSPDFAVCHLKFNY